MENLIRRKILTLDELAKKVEGLRAAGKTVVQSHGIFDLVHPGIIKHLNAAKGQGDVLVVTVIKDKDVRRGPGRPVFGEKFRVENVASMVQVDYVCLVDDEYPFECVKTVKPDVFARGHAYKGRDRKIHEKIFQEEKEFYLGKVRICETEGFSFSSSQMISGFLDIYPDETRDFLKDFSLRHTFDEILHDLNSLKNLKVLLIGDGIIDEYYYCSSMGKSAKAPVVVHKYLTHEFFAGGSFAIANHIASLCEKVHLVTVLGEEESREDFILNNLRPNVEAKFFYRPDGPTPVKRRYIEQYLNQKLFEVNHLNDVFINGKAESGIVRYLTEKIPDYDVVLISDFGHGMITRNLAEVIQRHSRTVAINTQTNAANHGYNLITKYRKPNYVCLDENEIRLAAQEKFAPIDKVATTIRQVLDADHLVVTLGKRGSLSIDRNDETSKTPVFSTKVVDTVGAGDAVFAFTSLCFAQGIPSDVVSFIGNAVGALAVQIVGNKKPVEKYELLEFVHSILR
jgi:rfaE bifunctional protein kinase chain/domain